MKGYMKTVTAFLRSEEGGEGSQAAVLIAVGTVVVLGMLTFVGIKIKAAVDAGGGTIDNAKDWQYGDPELKK